MEKLNCTNCPWKTDREACRACRQEEERKLVESGSLPLIAEAIDDFNSRLLRQGIGNAMIALAQFSKN